MLERAQTATVRSPVRSLMQDMTLGVSVGKIMRDLADEMRKLRKQRAEERAQKAPPKMLFPLVLLILPGDVRRPARAGGRVAAPEPRQPWERAP
jgi:tight adherence protein C